MTEPEERKELQFLYPHARGSPWHKGTIEHHPYTRLEVARHLRGQRAVGDGTWRGWKVIHPGRCWWRPREKMLYFWGSPWEE